MCVYLCVQRCACECVSFIVRSPQSGPHHTIVKHDKAYCKHCIPNTCTRHAKRLARKEIIHVCQTLAFIPLACFFWGGPFVTSLHKWIYDTLWLGTCIWRMEKVSKRIKCCIDTLTYNLCCLEYIKFLLHSYCELWRG